jgi:hypothetical protein
MSLQYDEIGKIEKDSRKETLCGREFRRNVPRWILLYMAIFVPN